MDHVPPDTTSKPGPRRRRTSWYAAFALLLAACGVPGVPLGVPPGLQVSLATTSVSIVRGATSEVQVDLTRLGGAADPVDLSVAGLPANVTASFSPMILDGAVLTSTLTITVAAAASEAVTALSVSGTAGTLSDDVALSLEVTSLTVVGRVQATLARPLVGAAVGIQGQSRLTNGFGDFTITGVSVPYDVTVSSALGSAGLHVFEGMTSTSPLLKPTFAALTTPGLFFSAGISGSILGGAVGVDEVVVVCVEGLAVAVYGCDVLGTGDTGFSLSAAWFDGTMAAARLHAFHIEVDADDVPTAYLGYDTIELNLSDGVATLADLDFDPVDATTLTGTTAHPVSMPDSVLYVSARFGPNLSMPLFQVTDPEADFALLVPDLPGLRYDALFAAAGGDDTVFTWKQDVGVDAGDLAVAVPAQPAAPADGAVGVDLATSFSTSAAGGGARTYYWEPAGAGPFITLTTTRTTVTIPNPASGGFPSLAGLAYSWGVMGHGEADVDAAAAGGYTDFSDIMFTTSSTGGPGLVGDRTFGLPTSGRTIAFAP